MILHFYFDYPIITERRENAKKKEAFLFRGLVYENKKEARGESVFSLWEE